MYDSTADDAAQQWEAHKKVMADKWATFGARFEAVLKANGGEYMVGQSLTYADILVAHCLTWYVEEVSDDGAGAPSR